VQKFVSNAQRVASASLREIAQAARVSTVSAHWPPVVMVCKMPTRPISIVVERCVRRAQMARSARRTLIATAVAARLACALQHRRRCGEYARHCERSAAIQYQKDTFMHVLRFALIVLALDRHASLAMTKLGNKSIIRCAQN
jgi:hypothetical protein